MVPQKGRYGQTFSPTLRTLNLESFVVIVPDRATSHNKKHDKRPTPPVCGRPSDIFGNAVISLPRVRFAEAEI